MRFSPSFSVERVRFETDAMCQWLLVDKRRTPLGSLESHYKSRNWLGQLFETACMGSSQIEEPNAFNMQAMTGSKHRLRWCLEHDASFLLLSSVENGSFFVVSTPQCVRPPHCKPRVMLSSIRAEFARREAINLKVQCKLNQFCAFAKL